MLFYGICINEVDISKLSPMVAKHTAPIKSYLYVTELCAASLNHVPLGVGVVSGGVLWQMLVQIAAGSHVSGRWPELH